MSTAPVGTTFLAADAGDAGTLRAVLDDAAAAHAGLRWEDEQGGAMVAFRSAADALAAAVAVRRIWRRRGPGAPCLAVHTGEARREGDEGLHAGPGVCPLPAAARDRSPRADARLRGRGDRRG